MADLTLGRDAFIEENMLLVHSLCKRFVGRGIEYDDLYQAGCVGLVKAADAFDCSRGLCFSTYAVPVILGEIRRLFRDGGAVKVSRGLKEIALKAARVKEKLRLSLGREPTVAEISEHLGIEPESVAEALCAAQPTVSLTCGGEEDDGRELELPSGDIAEELCDRITIDMAFSRLDDFERRLIDCRYFKYMTQSQTAKILKISQVQVSRYEKKILLKLRGIIGNTA